MSLCDGDNIDVLVSLIIVLIIYLSFTHEGKSDLRRGSNPSCTKTLQVWTFLPLLYELWRANCVLQGSTLSDFFLVIRK